MTGKLDFQTSLLDLGKVAFEIVKSEAKQHITKAQQRKTSYGTKPAAAQEATVAGVWDQLEGSDPGTTPRASQSSSPSMSTSNTVPALPAGGRSGHWCPAGR